MSGVGRWGGICTAPAAVDQKLLNWGDSVQVLALFDKGLMIAEAVINALGLIELSHLFKSSMHSGDQFCVVGKGDICGCGFVDQSA